MKATLEFDLTDPSDREEFKIMNLAKDMHSALFQIEQEIRNVVKYDANDNARLLEAMNSWRSIALDLTNR